MYYLLSVTTWDLITLGVTELRRNVKLTDKDFTLYNWQSSYESDVNTGTRVGNEGIKLKFHNHGEGPTMTFSWLKAPTSN